MLSRRPGLATFYRGFLHDSRPIEASSRPNPDMSVTKDSTIRGGGPTGFFAAFRAGTSGIDSWIIDSWTIDSLPELGDSDPRAVP